MKIYDALVVLGAALLASGCGSVKANLTPETNIDPTEGIVVMQASCGPGIYKTEWYPSGVRSKGYIGAVNFAFVLGCNNGPQAYAVKEGTYFLGKVVAMTFLDYSEEDTWRINVKAGQVTYVGQFMVPTKKEGSTTIVAPAIVFDRSVEARRWLELQYPWMIDRYAFATDLARHPTKSGQ